MKKCIPTLIISIIILTAATAIAQPNLQHYHQTQTTSPQPYEPTMLNDDILDQAQTYCDTELHFGAVPYENQINQSIAQSPMRRQAEPGRSSSPVHRAGGVCKH